MIVNSYQKLNNYFQAFGSGEISLLIVRSNGGLSKTFTAKKVLKGKNHIFFKGHSTPLSVYLRTYKNPESLVVFDDVDSLVSNKVSVALLKQICELDYDKPVRYDTTAKVNGKAVPDEFLSNNKICLLCNDFKRVGRNIKALITRGVFIDFRPSVREVLGVFNSIKGLDEEIYNFLEFHSGQIRDFNIRLYFKCAELKCAGLDWKDYIRSEFNINQERELAFEIADLPVDKRNSRWELETGKNVRSLQRILKQLKEDKKDGRKKI